MTLLGMPRAPALRPSSDRSVRRFLLRHPIAIALFVILLFAVQIRTWWTPTPDVTGYFSIARSVWSGQGLSNLGNPVLHYAPGYPLLISPAFLFPNHVFLLISLARFAMALITAAAVFFWMRRLVPRPAGILLTLLVLFNISFWRYYRVPLSDLPMMMFFFLAGLAARRVLLASSAKSTVLWTLVTAATLVAAALTRQTALTLAAGFALAAIFSRRPGRPLVRSAILTMCILVPAFLAAAFVAHHDQSIAHSAKTQTYIDQLKPLEEHPALQLSTDLHLRISEIGRLLIPGMHNAHGRAENWLDLNLLIYLPLAILVAIGWFRLARRTNDPLLWSAPFYFLFYLLWPFDQDTRFFTPMLPILAIALWPFVRQLKQVRYSLLAFLCLAHLGIAATFFILETRRDGRAYAQSWPALLQLSGTIAADRAAMPAVAEQGLSPNTSLWLQYQVDRPVLPATIQQVPPGAAALVQTAASPLPAGFIAIQTAGALRLARRAAPAAE